MKPIELTPRMEHVRTLPSSTFFDELATEHIVSLVPGDGAILLDAFVSAATGPSHFIQGGQSEFRYPADVQIHFSFEKDKKAEQIDITAGFLAKARANLNVLDQGKLVRSYQHGMQHTLATLRRYWSQSQIDLANQRMDNLLSDTPIAEQLTALGTRSPETLGGAFAISNYLFTNIALAPVSVAQILQDAKVSIQEITLPALSVSFSAADSKTVLGGRLDLLVEAVYHNELIDEFDRLERKITPILLEVHQQLGSDGPIVQGIAQANNSITAVVRQLKDLDDALADQRLQIQSLDRSNTSLSSSISNRMDKIEKFLAKQFPQGLS